MKYLMDTHQSSKEPNKRSGLKHKRRPKKKPIDENIYNKYSTGTGLEGAHLHTSIEQHHLVSRERTYKKVQEYSARSEILLPENTGVLEVNDLTDTKFVTQQEIKRAVDITAATKSFTLNLNQLGPYRFCYSKDGRHMVLGGKKGHLASFDWFTKRLQFEINTMESIHDVCYLHTENMVAVAQKEWTYIYDNQGVELHCLKEMERAWHLEFLPYHFLLCSSNHNGSLAWLDVSLGKKILSVATGKGSLKIMCQNPSNAVIYCGHDDGVVSMWTPNNKKPALQMLCSSRPLSSIAVDNTGKYLATSSVDRLLRIWDIRNVNDFVSSYQLDIIPKCLAFSQTQLLALSQGRVVQVFKDVAKQEDCNVYMQHDTKEIVHSLQFCPYEDVLGSTTQRGFTSMLIPGSGEPNFDALEANPFKSRAGRREAEVKALLEKVPYELITMDPNTVAQVDVPTLQEKLESRKELKYWLKAPKVDVQPRYRMRGKSGSAQRFKRKEQTKGRHKQEYLNLVRDAKEALDGESKLNEEQKTKEILDRFKPKRPKK